MKGRIGAVANVEHRPFAIDEARLVGMPAARDYPAGTEILRQGSPAERVLYLESGLVKLLRAQADGGETIVGLRSSGWFLGAAAAILGRPYVARAVTLSRCRIADLDAARFGRLVREDASLSWRLHEMHSREAYEQMVQMADLGSRSARGRLEQFLHEMASALDGAGDDVRLSIPLRQWEIAQLIAVTPQYLCRLFADMEREGLLKREGEFVTIRGDGPREDSGS